MQAAQADAASSTGPDLQRLHSIVRFNAWGSAGEAGCSRGRACTLDCDEPAVHAGIGWAYSPARTIDALPPAGGRQAQDPALPARSDVVVAGEDSMLWALLCLANHSCSPNAHIVFAGPGPTALLRASRDLPAGKFHELDSAGCLQAAAALAAFRG